MSMLGGQEAKKCWRIGFARSREYTDRGYMAIRKEESWGQTEPL